jgi:hypothetical protein
MSPMNVSFEPGVGLFNVFPRIPISFQSIIQPLLFAFLVLETISFPFSRTMHGAGLGGLSFQISH